MGGPSGLSGRSGSGSSLTKDSPDGDRSSRNSFSINPEADIGKLATAGTPKPTVVGGTLLLCAFPSSILDEYFDTVCACAPRSPLLCSIAFYNLTAVLNDIYARILITYLRFFLLVYSHIR